MLPVVSECSAVKHAICVDAILAAIKRFAQLSCGYETCLCCVSRFQQRPAEDSISALGLEVGLYPPGRQIFLRRFKKVSQPQKASDVHWDAVWIRPEEIIGEGILVSKHATYDHYPFSLLTALGSVTDGIVQPVKRKTY